MNEKFESYRHKTRAVIFLLSTAINNLYGNTHNLLVDHSFGDGFYCILRDKTPLTQTELAQIQHKMVEIQSINKRIKFRKASPSDWEHLNSPSIRLTRPPTLLLDKHISPSYEFTNLDLSSLPQYELMLYDQGFILRIGENGATLAAFEDQPKLFKTMKEHEAWGRILAVESISDLNQQITETGFKSLIWVAEGLQEKRIAALADKIADQPGIRIVFVAGPSSSGKTTFTKRLSIHLAVNGIKSKYLSMDNYFLNREQITPQADGTLDFENVSCINLDVLRDDMNQLINHQSIPKRKYDFKVGISEITDDKLELKQDEILIFEGIHGLNPLIHHDLHENTYFRVYISALTQLNIDNTHPVSTSDGRLIRRMVRDNKYRGYTADDTIARWNSVRHGELHNIFPFQEQADVMFNSALVYELSILKRYALPLLRKAKKNTIRDRLITLLSLFYTIPDRHVPGTSILREFIGKSYFKY